MAKFLSKDGKFYMRDGKLLGYIAPVSKTWVINETPDLTNDMYVHINFTSRGISYKQFVIESSKLYYDNSLVCDNIGFVKEAFRTVVFETTPTGELLIWLQANAIPQ